MTVIGLLVALIVFCLAFWVVRSMAGACGLPAAMVTVLHVVLVVIAVVYFLRAFMLWAWMPVLRL